MKEELPNWLKDGMIFQSYLPVAALIKWAKKNNKKLEVEKLGDEFSGYYWKVKIK